MAEVRCLFAFEHRVVIGECSHHRHSCTEIVFNRGGHGTMFYGGKRFAYGPRSVFTYQPGEEHWIDQARRGAHLCFGIEGCGAREIPIGCFQISAELMTLARQISRELVVAQGHRERLELLAGLATLHLNEKLVLARRTLSKAAQAKAIIDARYREPLEVADLAEKLYVSPDYLRQLFRSEYGEGPIHYLIRRRIEAARTLLQFSALPVRDVAKQCGFENAFYFSRQFRKVTGLPPSDYRARNRYGR
jgi:AraC-like DNA-binding protein